MTRDQLVLQMQQEYAARREENLRAYDEKTTAACERCPGLRTLLNARHETLMNGLREAMYPQQKRDNANAGLPGTLNDYNRKIADALRAAGLPADAWKDKETSIELFSAQVFGEKGLPQR